MTAPDDIFAAISEGDAARLAEILRGDPARAAARDGQGVSAVLQAIYHGREELVGPIRANLETLDVFEAAALGDEDRLAELIRDDPASVSAFSGDGFTPIHLAAFFGRAGAVRLLIEAGAEVNARSTNPMGVPPVQSAAAANETEIARMLLDAGADPQAVSHGGFTALHDAAQNGNAALVKLLLERGAERDRPTDRGKTAADLAGEKGHTDVVRVLRGVSVE